MDAYVERKLTEWNLIALKDYFAENCIDEEAFKMLTDDFVKEIIPAVGPRIKFLSFYRKYKEQEEDDNSVTGMDWNLESQAITFFTSEIRFEKRQCGNCPIPKCRISDILNGAGTEVASHLRTRYSPAPLKRFLDAHPTVFHVSDDGPLSTVDVSSKQMCESYANYFIRKAQETERVRRETETDRRREGLAILHFSSKLRQIAPVSQRINTLGAIPKEHFIHLLSDYPTDVRNFVEEKYASPTPLECVEKFIGVHKKIFPESNSKKSVYVEPDEEVTTYVANLRSGQLEISDEDRQSETSNDEQLSLEEQEAVLYFATKMDDFNGCIPQACTPISSIREWYEEFVNLHDTVQEQYGGSFDEFLQRHKEVFWANGNGQYESISHEELQDYINQLGVDSSAYNAYLFVESNDFITEQDQSAVSAIWLLISSLEDENNATYSSLYDFYDACFDVHTTMRDYESVDDFLIDHAEIFKKSVKGKSYRVASIEEVEDYLFD